ncbi:MAG: hypothetical protein JXX29_23385 [Deltaproteobacteria bacterium]|nr:hypothetical protein [Deltaproteobacteria bacterium]MBN2674644.1 hypothetical protein [Deltaproteobacteria bacterium]
MKAMFDELQGKQIVAADGIAGVISDILIDDRFWGTNYFVVETRPLPPGQSVLIAAEAMLPYSPHNKYLSVRHSIDHIQNAPPLKERQPISKHYEQKLQTHFQWMIPPFLFASTPLASQHGAIVDKEIIADIAARYEPYGHLRSVQEMIGYNIESEFERVGKVWNLAFYLENWATALFVIDIGESNRVSKKIPMSPAWIQNISWPDKKIQIDLPQDVFLSSPLFKHEQLNERFMDKKMYEHYRTYLSTG